MGMSAPVQKITFAEMRGRREWVHEGLFCCVNRHTAGMGRSRAANPNGD
jgi:hypothetical protein